MAASYTCSLTEASNAKAKEELNESPGERLGAVETLRTWIQQQPHLKCPTDTSYLLRYLRFAHFSQLEARKTLDKYFTHKTKEPRWMTNIDVMDAKIQAFLDTQYIVPMPGFTDRGTKLFILNLGAIDPDTKLYDKHTIVNCYFLINLYFQADENFQVNGLEFFMDMSNLTAKIPVFMGMDNMKRLIQIWQGAVPCRQKAFHYYNTGAVFESVFAIFKTVMPQKMLDRITLYGSNLEKVYKKIPMHCLPREYLPDDYKGPCPGTIKEIAANFKAEISRPEVRQRILEETKAEWGVDETKRVLNAPQTSFRKLNVD